MRSLIILLTLVLGATSSNGTPKVPEVFTEKPALKRPTDALNCKASAQSPALRLCQPLPVHAAPLMGEAVFEQGGVRVKKLDSESDVVEP